MEQSAMWKRRQRGMVYSEGDSWTAKPELGSYEPLEGSLRTLMLLMHTSPNLEKNCKFCKLFKMQMHV